MEAALSPVRTVTDLIRGVTDLDGCSSPAPPDIAEGGSGVVLEVECASPSLSVRRRCAFAWLGCLTANHPGGPRGWNVCRMQGAWGGAPEGERRCILKVLWMTLHHGCAPWLVPMGQSAHPASGDGHADIG